MDVYFILWRVIIQLSHYFFYEFYSNFVSYMDTSNLISYVPYPRPRIGHLSIELWFLSLENSTENQELGATCACCYWGIFPPGFSQPPEDMCVYSYPFI